MTNRNRFLLVTILWVHCTWLWGQLHFINYTIQDGLPAENVVCAEEDNDGFMWFGTSAGVCRFDGISFIDYSSEGEGDFPGGVYVSAIEIDGDNNLWIGTEKQGIYYLNLAQNSWTHFSSNNQGYLKLRNNEVFCLYATDDGLMWYGSSNGGLGCIDIMQETHNNYDMDDLPKRNTWLNRIYDIVAIPNDDSKFYVIGQGYVYIFDKTTREYEVPVFNNEPEIKGNFVFSPQSIVNSAEDEVLLGSWDTGVKSFNFRTGLFNNIYTSEEFSSVNWRTNVHDGIKGEIWISHRQEGIVRFRMESGEYDLYKPEPYNRNGLLKGDYNAVFHSSQNHTWILTSQGISLLVPQFQAFTYHQSNVEKTNFFLDIDLIPDKRLVGSFAGENAPLKILNQDLSIASKAHFRQPNDAFQAIFETELYRDKILCLSAELLEYHLDENRLVPYSIPGLIIEGGIHDMLIDGDVVWLLIGNGSLVRYNEVTGTLKEYHFDDYNETDRDQVIYHGMALLDDQIWVATRSEIVQFNFESEQFRYFYIDNDLIVERSRGSAIKNANTLVEKIVPESSSKIWMLTSGDGVYQLAESESGIISILSHHDKSNLPQLQSPIEMVFGTNNDYWLATRNGLVHVDSTFQVFNVYGQNEGLRYSKLSQGLERIEDELYIGMPKGFAKVMIPKLLKKQDIPKVIISKVYVGGKEMKIDAEQYFEYYENDVVIEVATPIYHKAKSVIYESRLNGHSDKWQYSEAYEQIFRYEKLNPGKYQFEVRAKVPGTEWSEVNSYMFEIQPPYWNTLWFKFFVLGLLGGLGYIIYKIKLRNDLKEERIKTKLASLESQALRAQMNPHFIFNSLNSIKSLILLDRKEEGVTYLTKFSRMVRKILKHSKERYIPLKRELELLRIYLDLESLRFHQKFDFNIQVDPAVNIYNQMVPPLLIQPYVENSIWHGLLHLEGDAHLIIVVYTKDGFLYIEIEDNGIGRKASALSKPKDSIFEKKSEGMDLSKNRIDLISELAQVNIEDLERDGLPSGTRVTIKLPSYYGKEV
ncbi:MAG: histidine kinase [Saprospiraceae bacterium]|nr:histidine kinase [Saprospiraceae bacterium]